MKAPLLGHARRALLGNGSENGIFAKMSVGLAADHGEENTVLIGAAYRSASSLGENRGVWAADRANQRRHEHQAACHLRQSGTPSQPVFHRQTGQWLLRRTRFDRKSAKG